MFSARTAWNRSENRWSAALEAARADGQPLLDLTESNPTRCAIADSSAFVHRLGHPRGTRYEPLPLGHPTARAAVARYYERRGYAVAPDEIVLTASTSEAYAWLFTLLADRRDNMLVPRPSYPLLDWLAAANEVQLRSYALAEDQGMRLDVSAVRAALDPKTRAIVVVHPNNPTGTFVLRDEARELEMLAARAETALVVDEVFGDFRWPEAPPATLPSFVDTRECLTFILSGLSKAALLPQLKLGWMVVRGPHDLVREALARLELIADTYLSVGTPVQLALPELLEQAPSLVEAGRARMLANLDTLDEVLAAADPHGGGVRRLPCEGGWYALLEIPRLHDDEGWAVLLLEQDHVVVHPGYFFDFARDGILIVSLLTEPAVFKEGLQRVLRRIAVECGPHHDVPVE